VADIAFPRCCDSSKEYIVSAEGMVKDDIASMPHSRDGINEYVADIVSVSRSRDRIKEYGVSAEGIVVANVRVVLVAVLSTVPYEY
jgi:hypothetical protein